ncbi:hypothetical protein Dimus_036928 [Dionaea muscipula]
MSEDPTLKELLTSSYLSTDAHFGGSEGDNWDEESNDEEVDIPLEKDVTKSSSKKACLGVMSKARLQVPCDKMNQQYYDILLGDSSPTLKKCLEKMKRKDELTLLRRNVAETSSILGHALKREEMASASRKETRRKFMESVKENKKLMEELASREADLKREMKFTESEAIRLFLESEEFKQMLCTVSRPVYDNEFDLCRAHVRALLEDDDHLLLELEGLRAEALEGFKPKEIPKLKKDPTIWVEKFSTDPMEIISELGKELVVPIPEPPLLTFDPDLPPTSSSATPLSPPETDVATQDLQITSASPRIEQTPPPPPTDDDTTDFRLENIRLSQQVEELRNDQANMMIENLQNEVKGYEREKEEWRARVESLWWQIGELERGRSTMGLSPPSHYLRERDFVEDPTTALVPYVPPTSETATSPIPRNIKGDVECSR